MQVLQRSFSILLVVFFLMFVITFLVQDRTSYGYEQWKEIQVNRFLQKIAKDGICTYEQYQLFYEALSKFGVSVTIVLKEYQRETDVEGSVYWYLVSWEEIKEFLIQKGKYSFQKNSALELCITIKKGNSIKQKKYYIIAKGRDFILLNKKMEKVEERVVDDTYMDRRMV